MEQNSNDLGNRLRELGYRLTPQRQTVLQALRSIGGHASVSQIYDVVHALSPAIDRATVYRTIHLFRDIGIVVSADLDGNSVYELSEAEPHHHLVCRGCGSVRVLDDHHFSELADHLREEHNFEPQINHLTIFGNCSDCL